MESRFFFLENRSGGLLEYRNAKQQMAAAVGFALVLSDFFFLFLFNSRNEFINTSCNTVISL